MQDCDETVQLNNDCSDNHDDDFKCDESPLDVLLETMRAMDGTIC